MKWEKGKIADYCISIADGDHQPPPKAESGIPFVTISDITKQNRFDFSNVMHVPQEYYDALDEKRKPKKNDVLYSVVGSFGIPVFITDDTPFVFQRHIAILRPNKLIEPKFLYYTMLSKSFFAQADAAAIGAAQRTISLSALRNLTINVPSLEVQKRVISILSAYDDLIENNQKQIKLLEEAAQRLYKEWFVDLRFPGHESTPIVNGLPEGWTQKTLSEAFSFVRGKSYTAKELDDTQGVLLVNLKNIRPFGGYNRNAEKRFNGKYKEEQSLHPGDIIMGVTDMTQERRLVGYVALVPDLKEEATLSMDLIKLIPKCVTKGYLYSIMSYGGLSQRIAPLANGVNVLHLKPEAMMGLAVTVPPGNVMTAYEKSFGPIQARIEALQDQIDLAVQARDRLLPKLMDGELEV